MTNPDELGYNGWANYQTWNVALWIDNDQGLYELAQDCGSYSKLVELLTEGLDNHYTPDGVPWKDSAINVAEVDEMIAGTHKCCMAPADMGHMFSCPNSPENNQK